MPRPLWLASVAASRRLALLGLVSTAAGTLSQPPSAARSQPSSAAPAAELEGAGVDRYELGRRLFRDGILPSGEPVGAALADGAPLAGRELACAACHRRSGSGGVEAGVLVPPITAPALFGGTPPRRADLFRQLYQEDLSERSWERLRASRARPAYTRETLGAALRDGRDPTGRAFDPLMPRYQLDDAAMRPLLAYLQTLSAAPPPGVDSSTLHLASVLTPDVAPARRAAVLDVLQAYVRWKNADTARLLARPPSSPLAEDDVGAGPVPASPAGLVPASPAGPVPPSPAGPVPPSPAGLVPASPAGLVPASLAGRRTWALHLWELRGPPESWPAQLAARYREQPVFALVSGLGAGSWVPIDAFCEANELPCLFPNTELPAESPGAYALHFSAGLPLEARALARHLEKRLDRPLDRNLDRHRDLDRHLDQRMEQDLDSHLHRKAGPRRIVQVYRQDERGQALARTFRRELPPELAASLEDLPLDLAGRLPGPLEAIAQPRPAASARLPRLPDIPRTEPPAALVLWLGAADLSRFAAAEAGEIDLSATLLDDEPLTALPPSWRGKTYLTHPSALPGRPEPHAFRVIAWLRSRGVPRRHQRLQLDTWFALALLDSSLMHLAGNFSRDALVEAVERETERVPNPGVYPRLSLGPGQRLAAKGCYVVKLTATGTLEATGDWIVP